MASMYDTKDNSILNDILHNSPRPNMQRQDSNSDLNGFFNDADMAPSALMVPSTLSWGMDQMFDFNGGSEYPFPGSHPALSSSFAPTQAPAPFMTGLTPQNMRALNNGPMPFAGEFSGQTTAVPSVLMNTTTNTPSAYNTRQAVGSTQKRSMDLTSDTTEAVEEPAPKKARKTRKKRCKEMSKADQDEKRKKFLDRNKQAAHKCRQRKKEWTDNLQNRANILTHQKNMLEIQRANLFAELDAWKQFARQCRPTCPNHQHLVAHLNDLDTRTPAYYKAVGEEILAEQKEALRNADKGPAIPGSFSREQSQAMSRGNSTQSTQSAQSFQTESQTQRTRTERLDSGVSNMSTPENSNKLVFSRKVSISDEGVDVGNGQQQFYMPNQRLGGVMLQQWNGLATKQEPAADLPGMDAYFASLNT